ncbi:MerR family transcriptional regulator [Paenibacillus lycopersici]|uniref:MerR family transcriptional regulator n=1 Tax=Paenibacillus lycopersici TaxID=2704462 RepID=A0A6C0FRE8_9BACL|nr:MerR family transcriptional regulator [Paenibacillus lycopersici]QHT59716.1 MerR family transcriptional regulator [Paenibacillus lycopersici]
MYRISEVSERTGLPIPTIRYYEQLGLIDEPAKNARGYKDYDEVTVEYLTFISNLKDTDMPLERIKAYVDAYRAGDYARCHDMLREHAETMELELIKRQRILEKVRYKVTHFSTLKGGGI